MLFLINKYRNLLLLDSSVMFFCLEIVMVCIDGGVDGGLEVNFCNVFIL